MRPEDPPAASARFRAVAARALERAEERLGSIGPLARRDRVRFHSQLVTSAVRRARAPEPLAELPTLDELPRAATPCARCGADAVAPGACACGADAPDA
jgi:hypothetical protein